MAMTKEEKREYNRKYYADNSERREYMRKYYAEKLKEHLAKWYVENAEKVKAASAEYRAENPEKIKTSNAKWRKENAEKVKVARAKWKRNNPEKTKAYSAKDTALLSDSYIRRALVVQGFKNEQITPELIELKRITLKTTRLCRQLKN